MDEQRWIQFTSRDTGKLLILDANKVSSVSYEPTTPNITLIVVEGVRFHIELPYEHVAPLIVGEDVET